MMKKWPEGVGFGGRDGLAMGEDLFVRTLAGVVSIFKDIQDHLNAMLLLQMHDE
ncbi:hypothetical protein ACFLT2_11590 [Acidobacteriota bacterium]